MYRVGVRYTLFPANYRSWLPNRLALVVQAHLYSNRSLSRTDVNKPKLRKQKSSVRSRLPHGQNDGAIQERFQLLSADVLRLRQDTDLISQELPANLGALRIWIAEFLRLGKLKLLDSNDSAEVTLFHTFILGPTSDF